MIKNQIEHIVRAVIINGDKILLCENKKGNHYFLPGGHVDFGEDSKGALARELKEEIGVPAKIGNMIGVLENTYDVDGDTHHEVNLIFLVELTETEVLSQEKHLDFHWVDLKDLSEVNLLPIELPSLLSKWTEDREPFFESIS